MVPPSVAVVAGLISLACGQQSGWQPNQISTSMCMWKQPRTAVLRDTLYIDGGFLYWVPGLADGSVGAPFLEGNPLGLIYTLNFSLAFDVTDNITSLLQPLSKAAGGRGTASNIAPNFLDGALLANDEQFFMYGGLVKKIAAYDPPREDDVLSYQAYEYGPKKPLWSPGFFEDRLPAGMTRYVAYGAGANAPSENMAWYFSGLRSPTWGPVFQPSNNDSLNAVDVSDTLVSIDMAIQLDEKWNNATLPPSVKGRANPEMVWVPVGEKGILVVIGGVTYPEFAGSLHKSPNPAASKTESDEFMRVIDIYDVASGQWFKQITEGGPTALTRGCAVLAPAQDHSSFNIYYYGGYDGIDPKADFSDAVWVLSLPSFRWTKLNAGTPSHARAGHKCVMPYPDQMMVIGGYTPAPGINIACLEGGIMQLFNLSSGQWMSKYDPAKWSKYSVPEAVQAAVGGNAAGSATAKEPSPSGWSDLALARIFQTPYETSKIDVWYPYPAATPTTRPTVGDPGSNTGGGGGVPSWVPPVLGVVLGLVFVTALLVAFCLWRRRKMFKRAGLSEGSTDENGVRILSWIRGQPSDQKEPTVTTEDAPLASDMAEVHTPEPRTVVMMPSRFEMADTAIAELPDTSRRPELQDTGLTPVEIIRKHTRHGDGTPATNPSAYYGSVSGNEHASSISRSSGVLGALSALSFSDGTHTRSESPDPTSAAAVPSPGATPPQGRIVSGVSNLSEREARHLRQISEATVSSASSGGEDLGSGAPVKRQSLQPPPHNTIPETPSDGPTPSPLSPPGGGPISPPTAGDREGEDYLSAKPVSPNTASPLRRSVFHESEDDMSGRK